MAAQHCPYLTQHSLTQHYLTQAARGGKAKRLTCSLFAHSSVTTSSKSRVSVFPTGRRLAPALLGYYQGACFAMWLHRRSSSAINVTGTPNVRYLPGYLAKSLLASSATDHIC
jgi:hypothetical protein